jgi:hypothetical protein
LLCFFRCDHDRVLGLHGASRAGGRYLLAAAIRATPQPPQLLISRDRKCHDRQTIYACRIYGTGITHNPDNSKYVVLVFYRLERKQDAERIVGALRSAGYRSDGGESSLDEVIAPDKRPGLTLIRTTALARPIVAEVSKVVGFAIPVKSSSVSLFADDVVLQRGNVQIDLF